MAYPYYTPYHLSRVAMQNPVPHGPDAPGWPWMDADRLRELLDDRELTVPEAADRLGCHEETLRKWARRYGLLDDVR